MGSGRTSKISFSRLRNRNHPLYIFEHGALSGLIEFVPVQPASVQHSSFAGIAPCNQISRLRRHWPEGSVEFFA